MRDANPPILKPTHKVIIEMPSDVADLMIAKAGSMDSAVTAALTAYMKTDHRARDERIKEFVAMGRDVAKLAEFHGMTTATIMEIAHK
jgi:hypothetical protein